MQVKYRNITELEATELYEVMQLTEAINTNDYYTVEGLVEQEMDILLSKDETRSNWIRRPLSDSQLNYAALDVEYLIYLYRFQNEELSSSAKLEWHNQEIKRLLDITFNPLADSELERTITKTEEANLLMRLNETVERISKREKINPTLFFSKKAQKDFLRLVFKDGLDLACHQITPWRSQLIKEDILNLLK